MTRSTPALPFFPRLRAPSVALFFVVACLSTPLTAWGGAGASSFIPGEILTGEIDVASDEDTITFQGLVADKLTLKMIVPAGLTIRVIVRDAIGSEVKGFNVKGGKKGKKKKKKVKLISTGVHTLVVQGLADTTGGYTIKTGRKLSPLARSVIHFGEKAIPTLTYNETLLGGYPGTLFSAVVVPDSLTPPTALNLSFFGPTGATINTNAFESDSPMATHLTNFPLTLLGQHRLRTGGMTVAGTKVDITIILIHPAPGSADVLMD